MNLVETTFTYLLYHTKRSGEIVPFYVGESLDPAERYESHRQSFIDGEDKEAYNYLRSKNVTHFDYEVVNGKTEAQLLWEMREAGFKMYNGNGGRKSSLKTNNWKQANDAVLQKIDDDDGTAAGFGPAWRDAYLAQQREQWLAANKNPKYVATATVVSKSYERDVIDSIKADGVWRP